MTALGGGLTAAATVVAGGFAFAVKSAADFEKQISAVAAVSGATEQELESIRKKALELGADTSFSASEAATAMEELVKAGIPVKDVLAGAADATVALAAAGGVALPDAATLAANAMNAFGLEASEAGRIADIVAGAANASAIDVGEFGQSLQQVGAVANLAGLSFDDTAIAIAQLGNAGIKGSDAGTSLKTFLSNLIPVTQKQSDAFRELGLLTFNSQKAMDFLRVQGVKPLGTDQATLEKQLAATVAEINGLKPGSAAAGAALDKLTNSTTISDNAFFDAAGNLKSLSEVQGILNSSTKNLTKEQKLATLETLFGSDAIRAAAILAENGSAGYDELSASMKGVTAESVAFERLNNTAGDFEQLKGSLETLAITVGTLLLPAVRAIIGFVTDLVNKFLDLSPGMQKAIVAFVGITAAIIGVIGVVLLIAGAVGAFMAVLAPVAAAIGVTVGALVGIIAVVPIIIAAIVALAILIFVKFDTIKAFTIAVFTAIKDFLVGVWNSIFAFFSGVFSAISGAFTTAFSAIASFLGTVWGGIKSAVETVFDAILAYFEFVFNVYKEIVTTVFDAIKAVVETVLDVISTIISTVLGAIQATWEQIWGTFGPLVKAALDLVIAIFNFFFQLAQFLFNSALLGLKTLVQLAFDGIKAIIQFVMDGVLNVIRTVWSLIEPIVSRAVSTIKTVIESAFKAVLFIVESVWNGIKIAIDTVLGILIPIITAAMNTAKSIISTVMNAVEAVVSTVWEAVKSVISGAIGAVLASIRTLSSIASTIGGFFGDALEAAKEKIGELVALVTGLGARIVRGLGNMGKLLFNAGKDIIQGLIDGVTNMIGKLTSKLESITKLIPDVKGPESVDKVLLKPAGISIMQGLIRGLESEVPNLQGMLGDVTATVRTGIAPPAVVTATALQNVSATTVGVPTAAPSGDSWHIDNVTIPAKDLEEMRTVADFFERIEQEGRKRARSNA